MDRSWIHLSFPDNLFINGVKEFVGFTKLHHRNKAFIPCPCGKCRNQGKAKSHDEVTEHCFKYGFDSTYKVWCVHGEKSIEDQNVNTSNIHKNVYEMNMNDVFNTELEKRLENMENKLEAYMIEIRTLFAARTSVPDSPSSSSHASSNSVTVDNTNCIGKECDMRGGCRWPLQVVARGIVQDVDPLIDFGNRKLEEGNFKVYVNVVYDPNVQLPCPHDEYFTTLGHIGQGSVIWPRELLVFNSSASMCS